MHSVGKLFALAAIIALVLGVARWPKFGSSHYAIFIGKRGYGIGPDYWAFFMGATFAVSAAVYYWFPLLFSCSISARMSHLHFWISVLAAFGFLLLAPGLQTALAPRGVANR